ncbi:hypothetical protein V7x_40770 [Crateriforma conspicua]|uniref:Uncharacterized protein n=1 Tax=Crateriforma conspicua TaxID=2527996 RepID=A0A5C6FNV6_9PLAN|nr:hypothetical protein V7x_40770 [Crateriforma conspicua]
MKEFIHTILLSLVENSDQPAEPCLACEQFVWTESPHVLLKEVDGSASGTATVVALLHPECELRYFQMPIAPRFRNALLSGEPSKGFNRFDDKDRARTVGGFEWDAWKLKADMKGVPTDLACLGRDLMREAFEQSWSKELQAECGWKDRGIAMIELAMTSPSVARQRWTELMYPETRSRPGSANGSDDEPLRR